MSVCPPMKIAFSARDKQAAMFLQSKLIKFLSHTFFLSNGCIPTSPHVVIKFAIFSIIHIISLSSELSTEQNNWDQHASGVSPRSLLWHMRGMGQTDRWTDSGQHSLWPRSRWPQNNTWPCWRYRDVCFDYKLIINKCFNHGYKIIKLIC